jgi:hypothetical protein
MPITVEILKALIEDELASVSDARVIAHVRGMLVEPYALQCGWDHGEPGQQYPCWVVLTDGYPAIAYSEYGFGPRSPWGLLCAPVGERQSVGMDSGWFTTFLDAFFESMACVDLPIWKVFAVEADGQRIAVTGEGEWEAAWNRVYGLRRSDPGTRYDVWHSIEYGRPHVEPVT